MSHQVEIDTCIWKMEIERYIYYDTQLLKFRYPLANQENYGKITMFSK